MVLRRRKSLLSECVREPHEICHRERLATRAGGDAGALQIGFVGKRLERVAQRLAALAKGRGEVSA